MHSRQGVEAMTQTQARTRIERDSMGPVEVPTDAYYGGQTMRAVNNFPISNLRFPRAFIKALGQIKLAAAQVNAELGLLDPRLGAAIEQAAQEVVDGRHDSQFVVDIFQTGSGTSTNMNANEVIADRAIEILGGERGSKKPVHPNDHVNKGSPLTTLSRPRFISRRSSPCRTSSCRPWRS